MDSVLPIIFGILVAILGAMVALNVDGMRKDAFTLAKLAVGVTLFLSPFLILIYAALRP